MAAERGRAAKYGAETLATFFLVLLGTGAVVVQGVTGALGHAGVSLVFGLLVLSIIYAAGHVSGAHMNPAATFAFWSAGRITAGEALRYVAAQLAGAVAASMTLKMLFPYDRTRLGLTVPSGTASQAFAMEFLLTFFLIYVVLSVATDERAEGPLAGVAIGAAVAVCAFVGGPVSGASMNPARSFGPALASFHFSHHWLYWAAPLLGALAGERAHRLVRCPPTGAPGHGCC